MTYQQKFAQTETRWVSGLYDAQRGNIEETFRDKIKRSSIKEAFETGHGICRVSTSHFGERVLDAASLPIPLWARGSDHWWDHEPSLIFGLALWCRGPCAMREWLRGDVLPKQVAMLAKTYPASSVVLIGKWDHVDLKVLENHGFLSAEPVDELYRSWHDKMDQFASSEIWCMKK